MFKQDKLGQMDLNQFISSLCFDDLDMNFFPSFHKVWAIMLSLVIGQHELDQGEMLTQVF